MAIHWEEDTNDNPRCTVGLREQNVDMACGQQAPDLAQMVHQQQKMMQEVAITMKKLQENLQHRQSGGLGSQRIKCPLQNKCSQLICYNCQEVGRIGWDCPNGNQVQCLKCTKFRHVIADCYSKRKKAASNAQSVAPLGEESNSNSEN